MYDQFDKKLSDRIKYVFEQYEDDSSDIGWKELRKNFPGSPDRRPLIYWISAAAAVLLCLGTWVYIQQNTGEELTTAGNTSKVLQKHQSGQANQQDQADQINQADPKQETDRTADHVITSLYAGQEHRAAATGPVNEPGEGRPIYTVDGTETPPANPETAPAVATPPGTPATTAPAAVAASPAVIKDSVNSAPVYAHQPAEEKAPVINSDDEYVRAQARKLSDIDETPGIKHAADKKISKLSFGVFAGSYVNYAEGSKSAINTGVGLSSEIAVTKKLKISTGVSLAQNSLKYEKMIPERAATAFLARPSTAEAYLTTNSLQAKTSSLSYSINGYDASLLGLDFPVNIKYMFIENKKDLYVVAGISSNFFIDEAYTYDYQYNSNDASATAYKDEKTESNVSSFDFARMLNLSVGFGYPIGKQSKLSFEPFVKYPLGGLGTQNIRFGAAGLNLKLNFSTK